jgi:hypothetical protein
MRSASLLKVLSSSMTAPLNEPAVKSAFQDIRVIGDNPFLTRRILLWSAETQVPFVSEESRRREVMVREQIEREAVKEAISREEFLATLNCKINNFELRGAIFYREDRPAFRRRSLKRRATMSAAMCINAPVLHAMTRGSLLMMEMACR